MPYIAFISILTLFTNSFNCKKDYVVKINEIVKIDFDKSIIYLSKSGTERLKLIKIDSVKKIKIEKLKLEFTTTDYSNSYYPFEPVIISWGTTIILNENEIHFSLSHLKEHSEKLDTFLKWYKAYNFP